MKQVQLELIRNDFQDERTFGELYLIKESADPKTREKEFICYTLEDTVRETNEKVSDWKVYAQTAIPVGNYRLDWNYSPRFKTKKFQVMDVSGFTGIRIHAGNTERNTAGCILLGMERDSTTLLRSQEAVEKFEKMMLPIFFNKDEIWLDIN